MTIFFCIFTVVFLLGCLGIPAAWSKQVTESSFLPHDITAAINGFFISVIFLSHLRSYIDKADYTVIDQGFLTVISFLGQLVVATFLFYSGYGIMESIRCKGEGYILNLPRKRILPFLLDVWVALVFFLFARTILGKEPVTVDRLILSMVGWKSIGNSNWYIFAILNLWLFTYLAFRVFPHEKTRWAAILLTFLLTLGYCWLMRREGVGKHFYNTVLCYPAGMMLSYSLTKMDNPTNHFTIWRICLIILLSPLFLYFHSLSNSRALIFNAAAVLFALLVSLCLRSVKHVSKPFVWAGNNLFYLFIYQRIPMMLFDPILHTDTFLFTTASLTTVIPLCLLMKRINAKWRDFLLFDASTNKAPSKKVLDIS